MFSNKKGEFGYLKKQAVRTGLFVLLLVIMSAGLFLLGFKLTGDSKNLLTVAAVLGMLPAAKVLVSMIMYMCAEKYSCSKNDKDEISAFLGDYELYGYDFYLTSYNSFFPIIAATCAKGTLICYMAQTKKATANACEDHIEEYMKKNSISGVNVKVFTDRKKFMERLKALSEDEYEAEEKEQAAFALLKSLTL